MGLLGVCAGHCIRGRGVRQFRTETVDSAGLQERLDRVGIVHAFDRDVAVFHHVAGTVVPGAKIALEVFGLHPEIGRNGACHVDEFARPGLDVEHGQFRAQREDLRVDTGAGLVLQLFDQLRADFCGTVGAHELVLAAIGHDWQDGRFVRSGVGFRRSCLKQIQRVQVVRDRNVCGQRIPECTIANLLRCAVEGI